MTSGSARLPNAHLCPKTGGCGAWLFSAAFSALRMLTSSMLSASNRCLEGVKWALQAAGASVGRLDCGAWFETNVYLRSGSTILRSFFFHWREIPSARALSHVAEMWWTAETASVCRKGCQKTLHVVFVSLHSLPFTPFIRPFISVLVLFLHSHQLQCSCHQHDVLEKLRRRDFELYVQNPCERYKWRHCVHCGEHVGAKLAMQRTSLPYVVALQLSFYAFPENYKVGLCSCADTKSRCVVWFQMLAATLSCKISALPFGQCRLCCVAISYTVSVLIASHIELSNAIFSLFGLLVAVSFEAAYAGPCVPVAYNPSLLRVAPPPSTQHE